MVDVPHDLAHRYQTRSKSLTAIQSAALSASDLGQAVVKIQTVVKERDEALELLATSNRAIDKLNDRVHFLEGQLAQAQDDRDLYMRTAATYAETINGIWLLAGKAHAAVMNNVEKKAPPPMDLPVAQERPTPMPRNTLVDAIR